jgi:hypothetical protein
MVPRDHSDIFSLVGSIGIYACALLLPARLPALELPPDLRQGDLSSILKNHSEDLSVPTPSAAAQGGAIGRGFPDLSFSAKLVSAPGSEAIFRPGDHLLLLVTVSNRGRGPSHSPTVRLSGDPLLFNVIPDKITLPDIAAGGQRTARFDSGALPANLPARQFQVSVAVRDSDGFTAPSGKSFALAMQPKAEEEGEVLPFLEPVPETNVNGYPHGAAVVVGIGEYNSEDAGMLPYAAADADIMAQYLVAMMGIPKDRVWVIKDSQATKSYILATIQGQLAGKGYDPVVFYFSGHGLPDPEDPASGDSCIVPFDGDFQKGYGGTLIKLNEMTRLVESTTKGKALIVLDACFSGSPEGSRAPKILASERGIAIEPKVSVNRATIIAGTSGIQPSLDFKEQRHGYFTYFLLAGMQRAADLNNSGQITVREAFAWARDRVSKMTHGRQVPELINPSDLVISKWR